MGTVLVDIVALLSALASDGDAEDGRKSPICGKSSLRAESGERNIAPFSPRSATVPSAPA